MPLDDREQQILAELERSLYEQHPDLVRVVGKMKRAGNKKLRWWMFGLVTGMIIVLASFTSQTFVALAGFAVMVVSATGLVKGLFLRHRFQEEGVGRSKTPGGNWKNPFRPS